VAAKKSRRSRGDGALFYRADRDRWMGRISVNGNPRTVSARTKTEARYKLDQLRRAANDGLPTAARAWRGLRLESIGPVAGQLSFMGERNHANLIVCDGVHDQIGVAQQANLAG
jgi:hypothetical protein